MIRSAIGLFLLTLVPILSSCNGDSSGTNGKDSADASSTMKRPDPSTWVMDSAHYANLPRNPAPLRGGSESVEGVVTATLNALHEQDTLALKNLLVTRNEFVNIIYPELGKHWPGSRDMRPEIKDFVWGNHAGNTMKGLRRALRDLGGRELKLQKIEFTGGSQEYPSYTIHEEPVVTVLDETGREYRFEAIGSIIEKEGVFKLMAFRDRE